MIADLIHSCSNAYVARAALASIGSGYLERVEAMTPDADLSAGAFAARAVRRFARDAGERDFAELADAVAGSEQPVLAGLRFIVERAFASARYAGAAGESPFHFNPRRDLDLTGLFANH